MEGEVGAAINRVLRVEVVAEAVGGLSLCGVPGKGCHAVGLSFKL